MRGLLIGLVAALAVGAAVVLSLREQVPTAADPEPTRADRTTARLRCAPAAEETIAPGAAGEALPVPPGPPASVDEADAQVLRTLRSGSVEELRLLRAEQHQLSRSEIAAAIERVTLARQAEDTELLYELVRLLGAADDPVADALLVTLLADLTYSVPTDLPYWFRRWLSNSRVEGTAKATRARYRADMRIDPTGWQLEEWLKLFAATASEEEVPWLLGLWDDPEMGDYVRQAAAISPHPVAAQRVVAWASTLEPKEYVLVQVVQRMRSHDPAGALAVLEAVIREHSLDGSCGANAPSLMREYASAAESVDLARGKLFLLSLEDPATRLAAVYAVKWLRYRKQDVSDLGSIERYPLEVVAAYAAGRVDLPLHQAVTAIEDLRETWSAETVAALERAAGQLRGELVGERIQDLADTIREALTAR